jgi:antitoxin component of MazEF toxin-antitoxin module
MIIWQKLHKVGNNYVITIPNEEVERLKLQEGQLLAIEIQPAEIDSTLSPDLHKAFGESWQRNEHSYRHLAEH